MVKSNLSQIRYQPNSPLQLSCCQRFCVYLRGLHVGMSEQLAGGIKVGSEGKHHRGERMAAGVIGDFLGDACRFRPFRQYLVDVGFGNQPLKHIFIVLCLPTFRQPFYRLSGKRQEDGRRSFCITTEARHCSPSCDRSFHFSA